MRKQLTNPNQLAGTDEAMCSASCSAGHKVTQASSKVRKYLFPNPVASTLESWLGKQLHHEGLWPLVQKVIASPLWQTSSHTRQVRRNYNIICGA